MKLIAFSLVLGLLLAALTPDIALAQRGRGGGRGGGGGGGSSSGGGGGGSRNFGRGDGGNAGVQSGGINKAPSKSGVPSNGPSNQGPSNKSLSNNGNNGVIRSQGSTNAQTYKKQQGSVNTHNFSNGNLDRNAVNKGGQPRTSYYRGNGNFNRSNSAFFGNTGGFNNAYLGRNGFNNYNGYGLGYGYGGYNGYGGLGLGYGYNGFGRGYGFLPFLGGLGLGYGLGGIGYGGYPGGSTTIIDNSQPVITDADQAAAQVPANPPTSVGTDYILLGENDFRAGQYQEAIGAFRHAMVDEPNNAGLMLMISQALFQTGQWTQAAAATELAMGALPEDKWGTVVQNYTQLYGNVNDYTSQLKQLENAAKEKPSDPALRFLLGFHYGYLNYPQQAVRELGKAVELEGRDPAARRLHDLFAAKTGAQQLGPVPKSANPEANPANAAGPETRNPWRRVLNRTGNQSDPGVNPAADDFGREFSN